MTEFENLSIHVAQAALSAELEYVRWTKVKSILDMGCENMLSTSAARAASAFYGLNDNVTVVLEEKLSTLYQTIGVKSLRKRTGRVDCVVYKGNYPYVLIECKRYLVLNEFKSDVQRCCELIDKLNDKIKSALIVGLRAVHEEDKTDRTLETKKISDDLCKLYPKFKFDPISLSQEFPNKIKHAKIPGKLNWTAAVAGCITITKKPIVGKGNKIFTD